MLDALSDVLKTLRLSSTLYCRSELSAPWGLHTETRTTATFHAVRRGSCYVQTDWLRKPVLLATGDLVVFPRGDAHSFSDVPNRATEDVFAVLARKGVPCGEPLVYGGAGSATTILCGCFSLDGDDVHPLLPMLPRMMLVRGEDGHASHWLEPTLDMLTRESSKPRPGSHAVLTRITDILFVQLIRSHLETPEARRSGWLRGVTDPRIAAVLAAIHREPSNAWTVDALARIAGMSRSSFCGRFRSLVGESPSRYVTRWRLQVVITAMRERQGSIKELAASAGFDDEAAFSKVFKRHLGVAPSDYRRRVLAPARAAHGPG